MGSDSGNGYVESVSDTRSAPPAHLPSSAPSTEARAGRVAEHAIARARNDYAAATSHLTRVTKDFVFAIRSASIAFGRYPDGKNWLLQFSIDDFLESALAIMALAQQGVFNAGRRELRYMVEAAVKYVFVDQELPGDASVLDRIALTNDLARVPRSSVDPVDHLTIRMLSDPDDFRSSVRSVFGTLSAYTHVSRRQLDERYRRVEREEFSGFESATTLSNFARLVAQAYDIVLLLIFEGVGPAFTGDLFVQLFDTEPDWTFHRTRYVEQVSAFFDYKAERHRSDRT